MADSIESVVPTMRVDACALTVKVKVDKKMAPTSSNMDTERIFLFIFVATDLTLGSLQHIKLALEL